MAVARAALGSLVVTLNIWLTQGVFLTVSQEAETLDYLLVSPSLERLAFTWAAVLAVLFAWHGLVVLRPQRQAGSRLFTLENTRYLVPLFLLTLSLVPLANLFEPLAGRLSPWSFILWDLRWWWWPLVLAFAVGRAGVPVPRFAGRFVAHLRAIPPELLAAAGVLFVVMAATPRMMWFLVGVGDEPKYVRYCENFYQGRGFDIAHIQRSSDLPKDYRPRVTDNFRGFVAAVPEEAGNLRQDLHDLVLGRRQFNRAQYMGSWFIAGKRTDSVYQIHQPGLSLVLFPAYYVDRRLDSTEEPGAKFPRRLPFLHFTLLGLFALYGVVVLRLLRAHTGSAPLAVVLAMLAVLCMPVGPFAFQIYPEIAAGICIAAVVHFLLSERARPLWLSAGAGFLAGYLLWLHVRLGLTSGLLLAWGLTGWRRDRRATLAFVSGFAVASAAFCLYAYRLTGSLMPTAMYDVRGGVFELGNAFRGLPVYLVDHTWGVFAHAPVYLLALPGLWLVLRRRPRTGLLAVLVLLATAISSSGHDVTAGGTTPGRYLVAAVPLLMLFVADAAVRWQDNRFFTAAFVIASLLSIETTVVYDRFHTEDSGLLVTAGFSGWRFNQLFPDLTRPGLMQLPSYILLAVGWGLVIAWLVALGIRASRRGVERGRALEVPASAWTLRVRGGDLVVGFALLGLAGTATAAAKDDWFRPDYVVRPVVARERGLAFHATQERCTVCVTSRDGEVDPGARFGVAAADFRLEVQGRGTTREPMVIRAFALAAGQRPAWGRLRVDYGDGATDKVSPMFGEALLRHTFARPGVYTLRAWFEAGADTLPWEGSVEIGPGFQ